jgi:hypothetical protein
MPENKNSCVKKGKINPHPGVKGAQQFLLKNGHFSRKMQKGHFLVENTEEKLRFWSTRKQAGTKATEVGTTANALDAVVNL